MLVLISTDAKKHVRIPAREQQQSDMTESASVITRFRKKCIAETRPVLSYYIFLKKFKPHALLCTYTKDCPFRVHRTPYGIL